MVRCRKLKKVSWATGGNLCQIRQFSSEDCPSKVGLRVADNQQFKHHQLLQAGFASNNLLPGYLRTIMKKPKKHISIPYIKWKCPPKVDLNPDWLVASGEQSKEADFQKQREMQVFEAVYPRLTDIPPSPSGALCKDGYLQDDSMTRSIRTTPIEDEEATTVSSSEANITQVPVDSACQPSVKSITGGCAISTQTKQTGGNKDMISTKADVGAAASAALTALLKSNEIGSSIDTDILIDIFNNPEMVSMLLHSTSVASPKPTSDKVLPSFKLSCPTGVFSSTSASGKWEGSQTPTDCASTILPPKYVTDTMVSVKTVASLPTSNEESMMTISLRKGSQLYITDEVPSQTTFPDIKSFSSAAVTPKLGPLTQVKDANYYKNLIKQHGLDNQNIQGKLHVQPNSYESDYPVHSLTRNGQKLGKNPRSCMFHNTPRGCRKGLECPFRHDITSPYLIPAPNMTENPNAKRMKLGRSELTI